MTFLSGIKNVSESTPNTDKHHQRHFYYLIERSANIIKYIYPKKTVDGDDGDYQKKHITKKINYKMLMMMVEN